MGNLFANIRNNINSKDKNHIPPIFVEDQLDFIGEGLYGRILLYCDKEKVIRYDNCISIKFDNCSRILNVEEVTSHNILLLWLTDLNLIALRDEEFGYLLNGKKIIKYSFEELKKEINKLRYETV